MAVRLKSARSAEERADGDAKVREMVERALDDIARRGDVAVREMSARFDSWDREDFRLTGAEIDACLAQLSEQDLDDIRFAQAQVCNFAQVQKACLLDFEAETLPGVVLGHRNIPVASSGCYVPGGKYPLLASAHMSAVTAKVAGCGRIVTCAPPFKDKRHPPPSRPSASPGRTRSGESCSRLCALEGFAGHKGQADARVRRYARTSRAVG